MVNFALTIPALKRVIRAEILGLRLDGFLQDHFDREVGRLISPVMEYEQKLTILFTYVKDLTRIRTSIDEYLRDSQERTS